MFDIIWQQYHKKLHQFIQTKITDKSIADDILQEVFIKVHKHKAHLKNIDKLDAWLYRICRHTIVDFYRRQRDTLPLTDDHSISLNISSPSTVAREQLAQCIDSTIAELPSMHREILEQAALTEQKQLHIAKQLQLSLTTVKSRLKRARQQLKKKLATCCDFEFHQNGTTAYCKKQCRCSQ